MKKNDFTQHRSISSTKCGWIQKTAITAALLLSFSLTNAQSDNSDFERIKLGNKEVVYAGLSLSPDGKTLAVSAKKMEPIRLYDLQSKELIKEIDAGKWYPGSRINFSATGKYLLLQELNFADLIENKNRKLNFEVVDVANGRLVLKFEDVQDVMITTDEQHVLSLDGSEITFWNLADGSKKKTFQVEGACDALAISPDGQQIAISHLVTPAQVKADKRFHKKKKVMKMALKYKQLVSFYDVSTGKKAQTVSEYYDIVYRLRFSEDGSKLFVFQLPHIKVQTSKQTLTYVSRVDATTHEPLREGLTSQAVGQPDIRISGNKQYFAINSKGNRHQEIHLYDFEDGSLLKRFEMGSRIFEKSAEGEKLIKDSRPSFLFLPGDREILIAMGNQLILWNINNE